MRVLAHYQVGEQRHRLAAGGQTIEGGHGGLQLVAHAVDVHQQHGWLFHGQSTLEKTDHPRLPLRSSDVRSPPRSAWQTAAARASAASAASGPSSLRMLFIISCTWPFS